MAELDQEELEILEAFESGTLQRAADADELLARHREYAAAMLRTDARVNVRLTSRDLRRLGMTPSQTEPRRLSLETSNV